MCRMLGMTAVSAVAPSAAASSDSEARRLPSWEHLVGAPHSLLRQADMGCVPAGTPPGHTDSWGIGWFDSDAQVSLTRQTGSAAGSGYFVFAAEGAARGGAGSGPANVLIGHLRKASRGGVSSENAHPVRVDFAGPNTGPGRPYDTLLIAHNGTIGDPLLDTVRDDLAALDHPEAGADSDTVVLAHWLAHRVESAGDVFGGLSDALRDLLARVPDVSPNGDATQAYSSINLLIAHASGLYALRQFTKTPDYYTLSARPLDETGGYLVASEPTDDHAGWQALTPGVLTHYPLAGDSEPRTATVA